MVFALLFSHALSASEVLHDAWRQVEQAQSISVTKMRTTEEFPKESRVRLWWRKGGYFRSDAGALIDLNNPKQGRTYRADKKIYQLRTPLPASFNCLPTIGLDLFGAGLPIVGEAKKLVWHKYPALRIELDGRKQMTKETKLFVFVDPKTHAPIGVSANLGSMTQVVIFENLKLDPKIEDSMFQFVPP